MRARRGARSRWPRTRHRSCTGRSEMDTATTTAYVAWGALSGLLLMAAVAWRTWRDACADRRRYRRAADLLTEQVEYERTMRAAAVSAWRVAHHDTVELTR